MASKMFSTLFLAISSMAFVGFAQQSGGGGSMLPCVQKLLPCQATLISHSTAPPPPTCCIPLKQTIQDDPKCLCDVFNNPALLKGLNITQDDALNLAKNCHANADSSICKTLAGNPPLSPLTPSPSNSSSTSNSTATPSKSAAVGLRAGFGEPVAISFALYPFLSIVGLI